MSKSTDTSGVETVNEVLEYTEEERQIWMLANGKPEKPICPIYLYEDAGYNEKGEEEWKETIRMIEESSTR